VSHLEPLQDDQELQRQVQDSMELKSSGTSLWASLVFEELKPTESWEVLQIIGQLPWEFKGVFCRMVEQI